MLVLYSYFTVGVFGVALFAKESFLNKNAIVISLLLSILSLSKSINFLKKADKVFGILFFLTTCIISVYLYFLIKEIQLSE